MMIFVISIITVPTMAIGPLVPDGPSDREGRSTTNTPDDTVLLHFSWDRLDEVAALSFPAVSSFCRVDPSSFLLMVGPEVCPWVRALQWSRPWNCAPSSRPPFLLLFESLVKRRPHFREPIFTHVTRRFSCSQCH